MKKVLTIVVLFIFSFSFSQGEEREDNTTANRIRFTYDSAGNQIRRVMCINCTRSNVVELEELDTKMDVFEEDNISFYPNPIKEILNINWQLVEEKSVEKILVFNMSGQLIKEINNIRSLTSSEISFFDLPKGTYLVQLNMSNNETKTLKILKQ